jgi:hypothetical protein
MSAMTDSAPNKPRLLYAPRWSLMCAVQVVQLFLDDIELLPSNTNVPPCASGRVLRPRTHRSGVHRSRMAMLVPHVVREMLENVLINEGLTNADVYAKLERMRERKH